jgi:hypothetical protein
MKLEIKKRVAEAQWSVWKIIFTLVFAVLAMAGLLVSSFWIWITTSGSFSVSEVLPYLSFASLAVVVAILGILVVYYRMD